jgi:hypothetical protein
LSRGLISAEEAAYIDALLMDSDPENKKSGLQRLCWLYRTGLKLRYPHATRQTLNGLLYNPSAKVRRWALNAIALVGRSADNLSAVIDAIEHHRDDPETVVSGVPALFGLCKPGEAIGLLLGRKIPIEGATLLASAQFSSTHRTRLVDDRVNIEKASPLELRMATLLVGMGKAPENLFHVRYRNRTIIGQLNGHNDTLVAQYSIWAIVENPALGIKDLAVKLKDIESLPANVRAWIYRLVSADTESASKHMDYIVLGSEDEADDAREGLAIGLRSTYVDGLETVVFDWLPDEPVTRIRQRLLEHMAAGAEQCPAYLVPVVESYKESDANARLRLEGAAQRTATYRELRRVAIVQEQASLNLEAPTMVQNINTGGGSIGVVGGQGIIIAESVQAVSKMSDSSALKPTLDALIKFISSNVPPEQQASGAELVKAAANSPSKTTLGKVIEWLKNLAAGASAAGTAAHNVNDLIQQLEALIKNATSS